MKRREFLTDIALAGGAMMIGLRPMSAATVVKSTTGNRSGKNGLRLISIEPLAPEDKAAQVVADIKKMALQGVLTEVAFSMTLVPEGNPPIDKVKEFAPRYNNLRKLLGEVPFKVGILAQATVGHNYPLVNPFSFQPQVSLDGTVNAGAVCPYDKNFRDYLRTTFKELAQLKPDFIIVDDDFRLITNRNACLCPLHVAAYNSKFGASLTQEQLRQHLLGTTDEDKAVGVKFDIVNAESLYGAARAVREGIDSVSHSIPCTFCTCTGDVRYAAGIEKALSGKSLPTAIRLNNARYLQTGPDNYVVRMLSTALQITTIGDVDCILAETDTYPQNRYSTTARVLHSNFTGYLLEGCMGAKHWITRMGEWEPESGVAYREILAKYRGFYEEIAHVVSHGMTYEGPGTVIPNKIFVNWNNPDGGSSVLNNMEAVPSWNTCLTVGFGQPVQARHAVLGAGTLVGPECNDLTDVEIRALLSKGVLLDGSAASVLEKRGYGEFLGVKVGAWNGKSIGGEIIGDNAVVSSLSGKIMAEGNSAYLLTPDDKAMVLSRFFHRPYSHSTTIETGEAATVAFVNSLGGKVVTTATTPGGIEYPCSTRKAFLMSLLNWIEPYPLYYAGDERVYLKAGKTASGAYLVAAINMGSDPVENITFTTGHDFTRVLSLSPAGVWQPVRFKQLGRQLIMPDTAEFMLPLVYLIS
jgi:hypothetical protein